MAKNPKYVLCIDNQGYEADLTPRKIYEALPDPDADRVGMVRIVDESGEDYLFEQALFIEIELPAAARPLFAVAA